MCGGMSSVESMNSSAASLALSSGWQASLNTLQSIIAVHISCGPI